MTTTAKQTAGNNAFLADCRYWFNGPTYARVLELVNAEGEGAARAYLLKHVVRTLDHLGSRMA